VEILGVADELDALGDLTKAAARTLRSEAGERRHGVPKGWLRRLFGG